MPGGPDETVAVVFNGPAEDIHDLLEFLLDDDASTGLGYPDFMKKVLWGL